MTEELGFTSILNINFNCVTLVVSYMIVTWKIEFVRVSRLQVTRFINLCVIINVKNVVDMSYILINK